MPLKRGASKKSMDENFHELKESGYDDPKQRTAIVLSEARRTGKGKALKKFMAKYGERPK